MSRIKNALRFTLALLPIAAIAGYFTAKYQLSILSPDLIGQAVEQMGSRSMMIGVVIIQTVLYAAVCGFFGYILSEKIGLMRPMRFERSKLFHALLLSLGLGILFSLDPWVFGRSLPEIHSADAAGLGFESWMASILYGGIIEELMMRLFVMSLAAWVLWKTIFRSRTVIPEGVIIAANIIAAALFAAGHLPATIAIFGKLTPLLLIRCFLMNGGFGLFFGRLYRKNGIQYAMLSHACLHIVSKTIWLLFL